MQRNLNLKVKYRESFRPFAPSVLRENVSDWFELDCDSPYVLIVADVRKDRFLSAHSNGARQHQSTVPPAAHAFQAENWLPYAGQHQL
jgi:predicted NodU family carbamoyl transferase